MRIAARRRSKRARLPIQHSAARAGAGENSRGARRQGGSGPPGPPVPKKKKKKKKRRITGEGEKKAGRGGALTAQRREVARRRRSLRRVSKPAIEESRRRLPRTARSLQMPRAGSATPQGCENLQDCRVSGHRIRKSDQIVKRDGSGYISAESESNQGEAGRKRRTRRRKREICSQENWYNILHKPRCSLRLDGRDGGHLPEYLAHSRVVAVGRSVATHRAILFLVLVPNAAALCDAPWRGHAGRPSWVGSLRKIEKHVYYDVPMVTQGCLVQRTIAVASDLGGIPGQRGRAAPEGVLERLAQLLRVLAGVSQHREVVGTGALSSVTTVFVSTLMKSCVSQTQGQQQ
ncbi:unnamed protein product [Prorocentrum cordatum]|uniref:Uncharacterized protein n=1 Tax=Prorocentrum cordatum TaxID=2364126 RepID=A0ABN9TQZ0_9DINO|nr:unnamed protein product [Polarella glacialis]